MINKRIEELRKLMTKKQIDAYIIPTDDFHQSEYVGEHFKSRVFISGFTGSAGIALVSQSEALLWTDGRYFIQAEKELLNSEFKLQKSGVEGVPSIEEYLKQNLKDGACLAFDGRCVSLQEGITYEEIIKSKNGKLIYDLDLIDEIWSDRPEMSSEKAFFLDEKYSGESAKSKIGRIREQMKIKGADTHIISSLDDVCWTYNIRGNDIKFSPLVLSYAVITDQENHIFVDENKFDNKIYQNLKNTGTVIHPYNDIYDFIKNIKSNSTVMLDKEKLNFAIYQNIPKSTKIVFTHNPSIIFKACKNDIELNNIRKSHEYDGVAGVRFMKWLKENIGKISITEIEASNKLESFRKEFDSYIWPSFGPISAYKDHAASAHYSASKEKQYNLEAKGLYLSDTGGNYYEGSTDITRTVALGELTDDERYHFTLVLKSHIGLAKAIFIEGCAGYAVDILARKPLWEKGINFNHGTGHGVGYLLNVHEGPARIHFVSNPNRNSNSPLKLGMIVTDEPGIYIDGSHGIRTENEMVVIKHNETEFGRFFKFEQVTYVPIDLDAIDLNLLDDEEKAYLNDYHTMVFEKISPYLNDEETEWLKKYTRSI